MSTAPTESSVRAVLWDADGVLQDMPRSWAQLLTDAIGEQATTDFLTEVWPVAKQAMAGDGQLRELLPALIAAQGLDEHSAAIHEVWGAMQPVDTARPLIARLRADGVGCHLATNQDDLRASYMRARMGYDDLLDGAFYSCDLGARKPHSAFFDRAAAALGLAPAEVLFIDDTAENVTAARQAGLAAVHWHFRDGAPALAAALAAHGLS